MARYRLTILILLSFVILPGCASKAVDTTGHKIIDIDQSLSHGEIRLTCGVPCAFKYGTIMVELNNLHDRGWWRELTQKVVDCGAEHVQSYYYLGRAAEEMGYPLAAQTYYDLALSQKFISGSSYDLRDGTKFPDAIYNRLHILAKKSGPEETYSQHKNQVVDKKKPVFSPIEKVSLAAIGGSALDRPASNLGNDIEVVQPDQIDIVGLIPDVSSESDVNKIKTWSGKCQIGGMELTCVDEYIDSKLSALYVFTGKGYSRDEETNEEISNIRAFQILLKGLVNKFGKPQEYSEESMVNAFGREVTNRYAMWLDKKGNGISVMLYDKSIDKGNLVVISARYMDIMKRKNRIKEKERQGQF